jgi:hypothetical protein
MNRLVKATNDPHGVRHYLGNVGATKHGRRTCSVTTQQCIGSARQVIGSDRKLGNRL